MTYYSEKTGTTLLTAVPGATAVTRINGMVPPAWPTVLWFGDHALQIAQNGELTLVHDGPLSQNPAVGERVDTGSFSFHLTDGATETGVQTATVVLNGVAVPPTSVRIRPETVTEDAAPGTVLGTLEAVATAPVSFVLEASSLPAEIVGNELRSTAPIPAGKHSATVRAINAEGSLSEVVSLPAPSNIYRGQHPATDTKYAGPMGGEAEFLSPRGNVLHPTGSGVYRYVDGTVPSSGDGLSPATAYKTIAEAVTVARAGDSILVEPGVYAEQLGTASGSPFGPAQNGTKTDRVKLCRRGTGKVEITATDALSGWAECVSGDAGGNSNWESLWKVNVPASHPIPLDACVLQQSGEPAFLRVSGHGYDATEEMFSRQNKDFYWTAANGGVSGVTKNANGIDTSTTGLTGAELNGETVELSSATVFGSYSAGDLDDAIAAFQVMPGNSSAKAPVTSHNGSTIIFDYTGYKNSKSAYGYGDGVALINVPKDISAPGQWAYKKEGDGSFTIYFWPYDDSRMDEIRLTSRTTVMNFGRAEYWTFYGIDGSCPGGKGSRDGRVFWSNQYASTDRHGLIFEECKASQFGSGGPGLGIDMSRTPDCRVLNCTVDYGFGGRGMTISRSPNSWGDQCLIKRQSFTGMKLSAGANTVFSYSEISDIRSVHGNGMSIYQGAENIVVWGNIIDMTGGGIGMTNQESANLWIGMNLVISSEVELQHRGIENNGTWPPNYYGSGEVFSGDIVYLNNSVAPWLTATGGEAKVNGLVTGKTTNAKHSACNNVAFGGPIDPENDGYYPQPIEIEWPGGSGNVYVSSIGRYEDNVVIRQGVLQSAFFGSGNNSRVVDPKDVFTDFSAGNYLPKPDGPLDGPGGDHSDLLPSGAWIDWFDFNRDLEGRPFDWGMNPPRGALLAS